MNLPSNWIQCQVQDFADVKGGKRLPKGKAFSGETTNFPYIRVSDFSNGTVSTNDIRYIDQQTREVIEAYTISKEDLYVSIAGTIGLVGTIPDELDNANLTENAAKVCSISGVDQVFLSYLLRSKDAQDSFKEKTVSTTQPKLALYKIRELRLWLPPFSEQQQIAARLDTLLAQVDILKARLDAIPTILKRFRQSVLAVAVSGQLTEQWRRGAALTGWLTVNIGSISSVSTGKTPKRSDNRYWDHGTIPWLTSAATGQDFCSTASQYVTAFAVDDCSLKVYEPGTLLLAMYGEGKTRGQVTELQLRATCNQACAALRVDEGKALRAFVKLRLQENYEETRKAAAGGAQPNLNLNKVRAIPIHLPPLEEQTEIVRRVEQLFTFADQIEQRVKDVQARVNHLTQSILAKAFRGELTAEWREQNPELISGENSAEALLARIQAEQAAAKPAKRGRRKAG